MPLDYSKGKIYSIRSRTSDLVYIGSTVQPLHKRLSVHVRNKRSYDAGKRRFTSSFEIIEQGNYYIELVEEYPCENKEQLLKREGEIQRETECVNMRVEARTKKEYYQDNKKFFLEKAKEYREENREKLRVKSKEYREKNKIKITCNVCGSIFTKTEITKHLKTQKHIKALTNC